MRNISLGLLLSCLSLILAFTGCDRDEITLEVPTSTGIQVTGTGSAFGSPDIAMISIGVVAEDEEVGKAREEAANVMDRILTSIKGNGVAEKDIQTQSFSIYPIYDYKTNEQVLKGYRVNNYVSVKIRDIDSSSKVIDDAVTAGGNSIRVNSISFTIDDKTELQSEARANAMNDASAKAQTLADLGGVELGEPVSISETTSSNGYDYRYEVAEDASGGATPIKGGQIEVRVVVNVIYDIE